MSSCEEQLTLLSTTLGGFLAILGGVSSSYFVEKWKNDRLAKNLAWAFYGEINSLCKLIRYRKYVETFTELAGKMRNGEKVNHKAMKADNEYFYVYKSNATNIGVLTPGLPEKIVSFYTHGTAVLEDIHSLSSGYHDDKSVESMASLFENISNMFYELLRQGDEITQIIENGHT